MTAEHKNEKHNGWKISVTKIYLRKLTRYFKAAESSSSQLHPQQEDCQPRANIGAVETNTAASESLAVATASSDHGKDTSQASQPSHSDNESETGGPTRQPPETPCYTTSSRPCPAHAWLNKMDRTERGLPFRGHSVIFGQPDNGKCAGSYQQVRSILESAYRKIWRCAHQQLDLNWCASSQR